LVASSTPFVFDGICFSLCGFGIIMVQRLLASADSRVGKKEDLLGRAKANFKDRDEKTCFLDVANRVYLRRGEKRSILFA
jgi:hypothetical protein